jgi:hypothetical protein
LESHRDKTSISTRRKLAIPSMATMESQQRPAGMRPRSKSAFSITSDKSEGSKRSGDKVKLRESHDEKHRLAFSHTTKANPNAAMNELQPSMLSHSALCRDAHCFAVGMHWLTYLQLLNN